MSSWVPPQPGRPARESACRRRCSRTSRRPRRCGRRGSGRPSWRRRPTRLATSAPRPSSFAVRWRRTATQPARHDRATSGRDGRTHTVTDEERKAVGMRVRREVLGDAHVDRAVANTTEFTADFQDFITRYAWGDLWARPGLTRQQRSMVTLALLAGLGRHDEVAMHVRAALRNGLTPAEISEVLLHVAVYAGVPAANRAFVIADNTIKESS